MLVLLFLTNSLAVSHAAAANYATVTAPVPAGANSAVKTGISTTNTKTTATVLAATASSAISVSVAANYEVYVWGYGTYNIWDCSNINTTMKVTTAPKYGTIRFDSKDLPIATGTCAGHVITYHYAYYTWTGAPAGITQDTFHLQYVDTPSQYLEEESDFVANLVSGSGANQPQKNVGSCSPGAVSCGDPIDIGSGNVYEHVTDYETSGPNKLSFIRYYNSLASSFTYAVGLGGHWRNNYDRYLNILSSSSVMAERADGKVYGFTLVGGSWVSDSDVDVTLTQSGTTWTLKDSDDTVETYTALSSGKGLLNSIKYRGGYTQTIQRDAGNKMTSVTDMYNRKLTFVYTGSLITRMITPENKTYRYGYGSSGLVTGVNDRLQGVYYPISSAYYTYSYSYGTGPLLFALSVVKDTTGVPYSVWTYDSITGRAVSNQLGGGANAVTVAYNTDGTRTVTNANGVADKYTFTALQNVPKVTRIDRAATATTAAASKTFTYDSNGYKASETDWNGNITNYTNDVHGNPTSITEAYGASAARTTSIAYNATFHSLPATITTTGLSTSLTYDTDGNLLTKTLKDTTSSSVPYATNGQSHTWTYGWTNALPTSIKNPNLNTTSYTFDTTGALTAITNPLGQATTISSHTAGGYPLTMVDANGVTTTLTYDANMRLASSALTTAGGTNTTTYTYSYYSSAEAINQLTLPDGGYEYTSRDLAHRVTQSTNNYGGKKVYTLDTLGNITASSVQDSQSVVYRKGSATFDALGRKLTNVAGEGQTTKYTYDNNGNVLTITDPLAHPATQQVFDALNRRTKVTDPNGGITSTTYDAHDRVLTVTDANNHVTSYVYDGFGNVIQKTSPDTGTTVYRYDSNGNLIQTTDALNIVTNHTYDVLDRMKTTTYPASTSENITYTYDETGHGKGIGRLTSLTDAAGTLSRSYEEHGFVSSETRTRNAIALTTGYTYDKNGRIASITYPSGAVQSYTYNQDGALYSFSLTAGSTSKTGYAAHQPYNGPLTSLTNYTYPGDKYYYDLAGRMTLTTAQDSNQAWYWQNYTYDANDNVTVSNRETSANNQTFTYDVLDRVTGATGGYGTYAYTYDKLGNRLTSTLGGVSTTYSYASGSNRLSSVGSQGITTNANGSVIGISPALPSGVSSLTYNNAGRLSSVKNASGTVLGSYLYDAFGRRIVKTTGSTGGMFVYDPSGTLLEETDATGHAITDYIYVDGRLVDVWMPQISLVTEVHGDSLGTPQIATDGYGLKDWGADYEPFGATRNLITTGTYTGPVVQNLRLPGQYADTESGLSQNGFRDYQPTWGRYLESDPIGLNGGMNTYAYASGNPLKYSDRLGTENCMGGGYCEPLHPTSFNMTDEQLAEAALDVASMIPVGPGPEVRTGSMCFKAATRLLKRLMRDEAGSVPLSGNSTRINTGKQDKHIQGTNNYKEPNSPLNPDIDPQALHDQYGGTGQQVGNIPVGQAGSKERIDYGQTIGNYVDPVTGASTPTSVGITHYGNDGAHIVPARPNSE